MNISRRQLYAAGEPLGDSATRVEAGRMICGGGGGGSSTQFYENQDKLLGVQADIAQNMYNQYASYAPGYLGNSQVMVEEANNGDLERRMRGRAATDSAGASARERAATSRQLVSMGVNPNDPRFAGGLRTMDLRSAANQANAMNNASWQAEDQKWNRNAGAYGQIAGMGNGAMQGMSSAASGYGHAAAANQSANNANMAGYGQFGAAIGSSMFKADGGYIDGSEAGYASGGLVPMPTVDWRSQPTARRSSSGGLGPVGAISAGMLPSALGKLGKDVNWKQLGERGADWLKQLGNEPTASTWGVESAGEYLPAVDYSTGASAATDAVTDWSQLAATEAATNTAADMAGSLAFASGGFVLPQIQGSAGIAPEQNTQGFGERSTTDQDGFGAESPDYRHAAGKATMTAVGGIFGGKAGAAAGSGLAEVVHPVGEGMSRTLVTTGDKFGGAGGAMMTDPVAAVASGKYSTEDLVKGAALGPLGGVLKLASGGLAVRQNFQPGGPVQGPGGPTDDAIPAWLSHGEHVQNATSTQLAGVDVLDQINQIGLMVREGQLNPDQAVQMIGELMKSRGEEMAEGHPGVQDSPAEEKAEMRQTAAQRKAKPSKAKNFKSTKPAKPAKLELKEGK